MQSSQRTNTSHPSRRDFLQTMAVGAAGLTALAAYGGERRQPNVVMILTDDQGWGDLSLNGNSNLATPHIDRLAAKGTVLDKFYVQPVCAPTRAEMLTGRWYPRTGVHGVTRREEWMNLDEVTMGDVFKGGGYATGCFGKWHNGSAYPYHPNGRGFDEFYGFCCGHWGHYFDSTLEHNGEPVRAGGYINDAVAEHALKFIDANQDAPFLCYVAFNTPHSPFQVPDKWYEKFANRELAMRHREPKKEETEKTRCVLAMCENIDWNVGRIVDRVQDLGLERDTIFVYFSDNGPNTWRWNGNMRGKKGYTDEGGVRSPCLVAWPGAIPAGKETGKVAGAIDLLPTLCALTGVAPPERPLDGRSLTPLLLDTEAPWPDRAIFAHSPNNRFTSIRTQQYRAGGNAKGLFDMVADPAQRKDLSGEMPELHQELQERIAAWRREVLPKEPPDRPVPAGYPEFPLTVLNAQDGIASGDIRWSSRHPNASFFENWHDVDDTMAWDIEVQTAGAYDVEVLYTCPPEDVGAGLEVAFKGATQKAVIENAFDPPLKDQRDRVERAESYEKDFRPLPMGHMRLDKGRGKFVLRALSKPGTEVCDVRAVRLRLRA